MALQILDLVRKFKAYQYEIQRLIETRSVSESIDKSLDSNKLEPNETSTSLMEPALSSLAAHAARRDNPHEETAEGIGTYSREEVMNRVGGIIGPGVLPLSTWGYSPMSNLAGNVDKVDSIGSHNGLTQPIFNTLPRVDEFYIECTKEHTGLMSGIPYRIGPKRIPFHGVNATLSIRSHYALDLVRRSNGEMDYEFRPVLNADYPDGIVPASVSFNPVLSTAIDRLTVATYFVIGYQSHIREFYLTEVGHGATNPIGSWGATQPKRSNLGSILRIGKYYVFNPDARNWTDTSGTAYTTGIPEIPRTININPLTWSPSNWVKFWRL